MDQNHCFLPNTPPLPCASPWTSLLLLLLDTLAFVVALTISCGAHRWIRCHHLNLPHANSSHLGSIAALADDTFATVLATTTYTTTRSSLYGCWTRGACLLAVKTEAEVECLHAAATLRSLPVRHRRELAGGCSTSLVQLPIMRLRPLLHTVPVTWFASSPARRPRWGWWPRARGPPREEEREGGERRGGPRPQGGNVRGPAREKAKRPPPFLHPFSPPRPPSARHPSSMKPQAARRCGSTTELWRQWRHGRDGVEVQALICGGQQQQRGGRQRRTAGEVMALKAVAVPMDSVGP
nr:unnamed protein product [Digitaria exilis]